MYCAYLRKSRADRESELKGEEETLARHKRILSELSDKLQKPISKFYSEVVSGETISDRPVVQELLSDVESGKWDGVYVVEIERLARGNTKDQGIVAEAFKYSGTVIITPTKTYDPDDEFDEEYFEFGLFMSRREYKTINRRLQRGRIASVTEGNFIGSTPPYGYKKIKSPDNKGYTLEIVPDQADIVKQVYQWYCYGEHQADGSFKRLGTDAIAARLDSLGVKPLINQKWSKASIGDMLKNPTYTGKVFFGQRKDMRTSQNGNISKKRVFNPDYLIVPGKHPAIIDDNLFSLASKIRKENRRNTVPASTALQNPLSGIIYCKKCGALMTRLAPNNRNKYSAIKCPNRYCDNISSPLYLVEKQVLQFMRDWLKSYDVESKSVDYLSPLSDEIKSKLDTIKKIESDISVLSSQLNRAYDLLEQGVYTVDVFKDRQSNLTTSISSLENCKITAEKELQNFYSLKVAKEQYVPKVKHLLDTYETNSTATNNQILKDVIDRILYEKTERNTKGNLNKSNFTLHIYPNVPL